MSGWLPDVDGYAMLSAVTFGKEIELAEAAFDAAMRAKDGIAAGHALRSAGRHLRKAAEAARTIEYSTYRRHDERIKALPVSHNGATS